MNNYRFGNFICELREKKGLSQSQLGEKRGVTNKAVSRWENGSAYPSTEWMLPLAKESDTTIEDLYKTISEKLPCSGKNAIRMIPFLLFVRLSDIFVLTLDFQKA